jgi:outer membrane protein TolC
MLIRLFLTSILLVSCSDDIKTIKRKKNNISFTVKEPVQKNKSNSKDLNLENQNPQENKYDILSLKKILNDDIKKNKKKDIDLESAILFSIKNSNQSNLNKNISDLNRYDKYSAISQFLPSFNYTKGYGLQGKLSLHGPSGGVFPSGSQSYDPGFESTTIAANLSFYQLIPNFIAANYYNEKRKNDFLTSQQKVVLETIETYFALLGVVEKIKISELNLDFYSQEMKVAEAKLKENLIDTSNYNEIKSKKTLTESDYLEDAGYYNLIKIKYKNLLPDSDFAPQSIKYENIYSDFPLIDFDDFMRTVFNENIDIKSSEYLIKVKKNQLVATTSKRFGELTITKNDIKYNALAYAPEIAYRVNTTLLTFNLPISVGDFVEIGKAHKEFKIAKLNKQIGDQMIAQNAINLWYSYKKSISDVSSSFYKIKQSEFEYDRSKNRYNSGLINKRELIRSQINLSLAKLDYVKNQKELVSNYYQMMFVVGAEVSGINKK